MLLKVNLILIDKKKKEKKRKTEVNLFYYIENITYCKFIIL